MNFDFIRSQTYDDIASIHDLFLLKPFTEGPTVIPFLDNYHHRINNAFEELLMQLNNQPDWYWSCRARSSFIDIIITIEKHYQMLNRNELIINKGHIFLNCSYVKKAVVYIENNYSSRISFNDILFAAGTNHTTLSNNFKTETGMTVMDYVWYYRIEIAKKKLRFTDIPIKEIALQCGFASTEHFSRLFTKLTGNPPAAFRKIAVELRKAEIQAI